MKGQGTIQNLITRNDEYKGMAWFNKDQPINNFWKKLTSAYANLNHVMASEIIAVIQTGGENLNFESEKYAQDFAKLLIEKKVSIPALISVMQQGNLTFSGAHFYKFLGDLNKGYVQQPGLFSEQVTARMIAIKALPFATGENLSNEEKAYIQDPGTPLELVDILLQKPKGKSFADYSAFVESAVKGEDGNFIDTPRKTEVMLLGLKNFMNYENSYTDKTVVNQPADVAEFNHAGDFATRITAIDKTDFVTKTEEFVGDKEADQTKKTALANQLFNAMYVGGLIGTGYEKIVVEYVAGVAEDKRTEATKYAIAQARKEVKAEVQGAANNLRKSLLGLGEGVELPKIELGTFKRGEADIPIKKFLERAASSDRLQRAAKSFVMKKLVSENRLQSAAMTVEGQENVRKMAAMLGSLDPESFTLIGRVMNETVAEIQLQYNLNSEFGDGTMSRKWNIIASYPAAAFFAVMDFFTIVFEYIGEYLTRGAYKAYEGVRDVVGKPIEQKRENQEIFKQADVEAAMGALSTALKFDDVNKPEIKSTPQAELKNAIITFLNDETKGEGLKAKLGEVHDQINDSKLKSEIAKIKDLDLTQNKKALQTILELPEMNQGIDSALPGYSKYAKGVDLLSSLTR